MTDVQPSPQLRTVQQQARALRERGDLMTARTLLERAVSSGAEAYGGDHPDVLRTARMLAALYRETGEPALARRTLEQALIAGQRTWPENDPLILMLIFDLGFIAEELGNRHEARRNLGVVAQYGPEALGPGHAAVRAALAYLQDDRPAQPAEPAPPPPTTSSPTSPPPITALPPITPEPIAPEPIVPDPVPLPRSAPPLSTPEIGAPEIGTPAPIDQAAPRRASGRTPLVLAVGVAVLAAVAAVTTAVIAFRGNEPGGQPGPHPSTAPASRPAPTSVRLRDEGPSITVSWLDPSDGKAAFIVTGAQAGQQLRPFANLAPGVTTATLNGLNEHLQYCFTVVAVYSAEELAVSNLVCTTRRSAGASSPGTSSPRPTRS